MAKNNFTQGFKTRLGSITKIKSQKGEPVKMETGQTIINKKATAKNLERLVEINNDSSKKTTVKETNDGTVGGLLEGPAHYDKNGKPLGGIKVIVDNNKEIEVEGKEFAINEEASKKHWAELSKINQSAGNGVPINPPNDIDEDPEEFKEGGRVIDFNPNRVPSKMILNYAKKIKKKYPEVWDLGGNIFGNEAFENLKRVSERGYWLDSEEWMYIKWRSYVARHIHDFRIEGVIAMLKWVDKVEKGWPYMKNLIEAEIKKRSERKSKLMSSGGNIDENKPNNFESNLFIHETNKEAFESILDNGFRLGQNPVITKGIYTIPEKWKENKFNSDGYEIAIKLKDGSKIFWTDTERPMDFIYGSTGNKYFSEIYKKWYASSTTHPFDKRYEMPNDEKWKWREKLASEINKWLAENNYCGIQQGGEIVVTNPSCIQKIERYSRNSSKDEMNKGGVVTYQNKYNRRYGYENTESHNLKEISKDTGISTKGLQQIYNKGIGAYKTNPQSVRPNVKSKEQWAMGRVYSAVMGGKAARVDTKELKMEKGGLIAPNGKPTNLTPDQYKIVHTPQFKKWFGYWDLIPTGRAKNYEDKGIKETAHLLKQGDLTTIKNVAKFLSSQVSKKDILIPMPSRKGCVTDNHALKLSNEIAKISGALVYEDLCGEDRESLYDLKKQHIDLKEVNLGLFLKSELPSGANYFIVDNVIGTGYSMYNAQLIVGHDAQPLVYAVDERNVSKVVDENGEPMVVYRGDSSASKKGNIFKTGFNRMGFINKSRLPNQYFHYFVNNFDVALGYAKNQIEDHNDRVEYSGKGKLWKPEVTGYFLNIRNFIDITPSNPLFPSFQEFKDAYKKQLGEEWYKREEYRMSYDYGFQISRYQLNKIFAKELGKNYLENEERWSPISSWVKESFEVDKQLYDTYSYFIEYKNSYSTSDILSRVYYKMLEKNIDGLLFLESTHWDGGFWGNWKDYESGKLKYDYKKWTEKPKVFAALESNQIKLADGTNTTFDQDNPDIRFNEGGELGNFKAHSNTNKLIEELKKYSVKTTSDVMTNADGETYVYHYYKLKYPHASNWLVKLFEKASEEITGKNYHRNFASGDYSFYYDRPELKNRPNGTIQMKQLEVLKMMGGGNIDKPDSITVDVPLMIRLLESAREDIKSDPELHFVVENLIKLKDKKTLTMDDYAYIVNVKKKHLNNLK